MLIRYSGLKALLKSGGSAVGPFLKISDPAIVEIVGLAGFDFVIIDLEYTSHSFKTTQNLVRAAEERYNSND